MSHNHRSTKSKTQKCSKERRVKHDLSNLQSPRLQFQSVNHVDAYLIIGHFKTNGNGINLTFSTTPFKRKFKLHPFLYLWVTSPGPIRNVESVKNFKAIQKKVIPRGLCFKEISNKTQSYRFMFFNICNAILSMTLKSL